MSSITQKTSVSECFQQLTCKCQEFKVPDLKGKSLYQWYLDNENSLSYKQRVCFLREQYHKTAIRGKPSLPTRRFIKNLSKFKQLNQKENLTCLNLGSGTGRDSDLLDQHFITDHFDVHAEFGQKFGYSLIHDFTKLKERYDIVICNYILNVIVRYDRNLVIQILQHYLLNGAFVVIGVRHERDLPKNANNWHQIPDSRGNFDGYLTSKPSFQHFLSDEEIFSAFKNVSQEIQVNDKRGIYFLIPKEEKGKATGLDRFLFTNTEVSS